MKKVLVLSIVFVMIFALTVPALAASGGFVSSPSGNSAPEMVEFSNSDADCDSVLKITSYADRNTLPDEVRGRIEKAYKDVLNSSNIGDLNDALAEHAGKLNIPEKNLAVSDLFDISYYDCDDHMGHGDFTLKLKAETLENFVGLLQFNGDKWEFVANAKVVEKNYLTFTVGELSTFAIVVNTNPGEQAPPTSDAFPWIPLIVLVASAGVILVIVLKTRKRT